MQDFLDKEGAIGLQRADDFNRLLGSAFHKPSGVYEQIVALAHLAARRGDEFHIAARVLAEDAPAEFDGAEARIQVASRCQAHAFRRGPEQRRGICPDALVPARAQQDAYGLIVELAANVP